MKSGVTDKQTDTKSILHKTLKKVRAPTNPDVDECVLKWINQSCGASKLGKKDFKPNTWTV